MSGGKGETRSCVNREAAVAEEVEWVGSIALTVVCSLILKARKLAYPTSGFRSFLVKREISLCPVFRVGRCFTAKAGLKPS